MSMTVVPFESSDNLPAYLANAKEPIDINKEVAS
ncbi:hypothetical protein EDC36_1111 [Tepidimonas ignava]|jgi:hypothetical protein|uniref:Uncharacterized protein n=1 Tax=Tepidimonas ignava TaxID=114249 RepID=A0A4R3LBD7_9BURK|nr:hypothetical protein EDC36_1111 [Tepidimonas ignava]